MDTLQAAQSHLLVRSSESRDGDLEREQAEVERPEIWPPAPEPGPLGAPGLIHSKDHHPSLQARVGRLACKLWKGLLLLIL